MPIQLHEKNEGKTLAVHVSGKLVKDTKFAMHHFSKIERLAIVGEKKWQEGMATFCKPFTKATVKYFDYTDAVEAGQWLDEESTS